LCVAMEDNERGSKKEKRCDAADVWETATPVSDQRCHRRVGPAPFCHAECSRLIILPRGSVIQPAPS
jgi:hypothetical protein